ncbi:MAG: hypothetical protein J3R72DRAFT_451249 [Linnemannia gamsii]|nr:MAG: hypothetical protein J3R72DRAFT_451249 [Linnemannia gamsii]
MASFGGPITRDNTGTVRRREITLTTREKQVYGLLWAAADTDQSGFITGADAVPFFAKSGLSPQILGQIWVLADTENKGVLGQQGFSVAVKLIAHAQSGKTPSPSLINIDAPLPHFEGITPAKSADSPLSGSSNTPVVSHSTGSEPTITEGDRTKYASMFMACGPVNGLLDGDSARGVFLKSKLPVDKLSQIWGLADTKARGSLDLADFTIAMFYIQRTMDGSITTLPISLPPSILKAASGPTAGAGLMSSPVLSAQTLARQVTGGNMGIHNPAIARQMTGSISLSSSPLAKQNTGGVSTDIPWEISPEEKAKFDRFFDQLDTNGDGFVEGDEAGRFFMNSRLPETVLAQIWDLSDITKTGSLSKDEFAVAMLLINRKNASNAPIPKTLPLSLIPPSLRHLVTATLSAPLPFGSDITRSATMPATSHFRRQSFDLLGDGPTLASSVSSSGVGHADRDLMGAEDLTSKITSETGELASMQNQINNLSNVTGDLQAKRAFLEKNLSVLSAQKQDISIRLNQIKTLHENETKSIKDMENTLSSIQPQLIKLREEFEVSERDLRVAQTSKTEFLMNLAKDQEESNMIRTRLRQNHDETIKLREELEAKKKDTGRQKSLLEIARRQLATSDADKQKLVNEIAQEAEKAAQIAKEIQNLSSSSPAPSSPAPPVSSSSVAPPPPAPRGSRKEPPPPPASRGIASAFAARVTPEAEEAFGIPPALRSPTGSSHSVHSPRMSAAAVISRQSTGTSAFEVIPRQVTGPTPFEPVVRQATGSSPFDFIPHQSTGMSGTSAGEGGVNNAFLSSVSGPQDNPWSPMTHAAHATLTQQPEITMSPDPETPQVQSESLMAFAAAVSQPLPTSPPVSDPFATMAFPAMDTPPVTKMDFDSAFHGFAAPKSSSKSTADASQTVEAFAEAFPDIDAGGSDDTKSKRVSAFGFEDDFSSGSPFQQTLEKSSEEDEFPPIVEVHHVEEDSSDDDSDDDNEDAFVQAKSSVTSPDPVAAAIAAPVAAPVAPQVDEDSSSPFLSAESSAVTPNVTGSSAPSAPIAAPTISAPPSSASKKLTAADFSEFETSFGGSGGDDFDSAFKGVELAAPKVSSGTVGNMSGFEDGFDFNSSFDDAFGATPFSAPQAPGSSVSANAFGASFPPAGNPQDSFGSAFDMNTTGNNKGAAIDLDEAFGGFGVSGSTSAGAPASGANTGFGNSGFGDFDAEFATPAPPTSRPVPSVPAASAQTATATAVPTTDSTTANSATTGPVAPKVDLPGADELVGMGFTRQQANDALSRYDTVERAANFLLEGGQ